MGIHHQPRRGDVGSGKSGKPKAESGSTNDQSPMTNVRWRAAGVSRRFGRKQTSLCGRFWTASLPRERPRTLLDRVALALLDKPAVAHEADVTDRGRLAGRIHAASRRSVESVSGQPACKLMAASSSASSASAARDSAVSCVPAVAEPVMLPGTGWTLPGSPRRYLQ